MLDLTTAQTIGMIMSCSSDTQYFPIVFEALDIHSLVYAQCCSANRTSGGSSAKPAKRRTSGSQIHQQDPADQQLHPHHPSIHHELLPYRQGRRPREACCHRSPDPAQRLRRGRLRQDQALPSSSSPGMHHFHPSGDAHCDFLKKTSWIGANSVLHSLSTSHRMCTSATTPPDTVTRRHDY
jgi:hypothetical protein